MQGFKLVSTLQDSFKIIQIALRSLQVLTEKRGLPVFQMQIQSLPQQLLLI